MTPLTQNYEHLAATVIKGLEKRQMEGYYCPDSSSAVAKALELMPQGSSIAWGGSMTLAQVGLMEAIRAGGYEIIDRDLAKTPEEKRQMYARIVGADFFLMSTNAITQRGELINIDGAGNRVASTLYGHKKVWFVVGRNKLAPTYDEALWRARNVASPKNAQRLGCKTPCAAKADRCYDCKSPERICRGLVVLWEKMNGSDMEVVLVDEDLGY
ncbi:MAG: lactate utilization protein [Desulfovibrio sp.]|nr:lactate utilization protein [Desulfovibrio sp.]